jgi:hypothetical protein
MLRADIRMGAGLGSMQLFPSNPVASEEKEETERKEVIELDQRYPLSIY